eukprot:TRINITY_DN21000_c0_g1_i1.p1 TRINITY_DN21000_c0_g1~~TRINITY_DN21000_c0_g1_i1.p1  ORF type:complete len:420 (-),score=93.22 TRINITY_DN21000_c0_g1_i1:142-1401(-)
MAQSAAAPPPAEEGRLLPRDSPFVGCLRHAPKQALAGQLGRLLRRRAEAALQEQVLPEQCEAGSSQSAPDESLETSEKLPPSSPYVGFQRHAPPSSPVLCFLAIGKGQPLLPPPLRLPGAIDEEDEASLVAFPALPGRLPEEVWTSVAALAVEVPTLAAFSRVSHSFRKVAASEGAWRDKAVRIAPSCVTGLAPRLECWLHAWRACKKLVMPRSEQLLRQVQERAPQLEVEVSWRFDKYLKGNGVEVERQGNSVRRVAEEELVVLGDAPLCRGKDRCPYLEVTLDEYGEGIGDDINDFGLGVTACQPKEIRELGAVADEVPCSWVVDFTQSMVCLSINNREAATGKYLSALDLKQGVRIGLLVKPAEFEVYLDGVLRASLPVEVAEERVPLETGLYPVLDLYGRAIEVSKSDAEGPSQI